MSNKNTFSVLQKSKNLSESLYYADNESSMIGVEEFRKQPYLRTGNPLIDDYGKNDLKKTGEMGRGVTFVGQEKAKAEEAIKKFRMNTVASDLIPLNRIVPDSRPPGCKNRTYEHDLPATSIIFPFYDEWPSVLLRTLYSIVNRTPRHLLQEIIMVDDASTMAELKKPLDDYISRSFPKGLVKVIRNKDRKGLIQARLIGWKASIGEVIVFFDSHNEVNIDWLQPLLTEIKVDRRTVAMGVIDNIHFHNMGYYEETTYRYGFTWGLAFFEIDFRKDQIGSKEEETRPGIIMIGHAFAVDSKFFGHIGSYDGSMKIWGGENIEMGWRVWMCGGRLVHIPCSHMGHFARIQPYTFPEGRKATELYNYKRAIEVWMDPEHKRFVYEMYPEMKDLDVGDLSERKLLKEKLQCHNFTWFLDNIFPELNFYSKNALAWGSAQNLDDNKCLDNHQYKSQVSPGNVFSDVCHFHYYTQGFTWTKDKLIRTTFHCLVLKEHVAGSRPMLEGCVTGPRDKWGTSKERLHQAYKDRIVFGRGFGWTNYADMQRK